ncbi:MAG: hypothetical protein GY863_25535 [bacterium]|nr:hypothetical protein [bacterium]
MSICLIIILTIFYFNISYVQGQENSFPVLKGKYLGQKPPGMIPEIFAQGIVTTDMNEHSPAAFSPDGKELFWSVSSDDFNLRYMKIKDGKWTPPEVPHFSEGLECSSPVFSVDGKRLYFTSQDRSRNFYMTQWYVEKQGDGWSERKKVDSVINTGDTGYQVSLTKDGTMYFDSDNEGRAGAGDIYRSRYINGKYSEPENLGSAINTEHGESSVFAAPDESFILFRRIIRSDSGLSIDYHISFQNKDGSWTKAENIGDRLNSKDKAFWIGLSPDGKYIFLVNRVGRGDRGSDMYWVDAKILDEIKKEYDK